MPKQKIFEKISEYVEFKKRPSVFLKPQLIIHNNKWCAWFGESIENGIAGYGKTPTEAFHNFDSNFYDSPPRS